MAQTSVAQFAGELKLPANGIDRAACRRRASIKSNAEDLLSETDKTRLLDYLRAAHGEQTKTKITLTRKRTSEIKHDSAGQDPYRSGRGAQEACSGQARPTELVRSRRSGKRRSLWNLPNPEVVAP